MKRIYIAFCLVFSQLFLISLNAQTVRLDATVKHQQITGFGAFVCSPTFTYNHMTTADIKKVWGEESTVGCNIMRLYIPIGKKCVEPVAANGQNSQTIRAHTFRIAMGTAC